MAKEPLRGQSRNRRPLGHTLLSVGTQATAHADGQRGRMLEVRKLT